MARSSPGVWRLHSDLTAVSVDTHRHVRRRVPAFDPTPEGRFHFRRMNHTTDRLDFPIFDLLVKYEPTKKEAPNGERSEEAT